VAIRLKDPVFESQTKNKLGNTEIRTDLVNQVREELLHFFNRNKEIAEKIIAKAQDTQQLRKELQEVKKLARERAKAITLRIPQLKDCKHHSTKPRARARARWSSSAKASPPPARSRAAATSTRRPSSP
jgi:topoisomerase-4 subunit B